MSDELRLQAQARALAPFLRTLVFTPFYVDATSYTPTYNGATPGTTTYSLQSGAWVRLGNVLIVHGQVVWTAATGAGNAQISIPVTPGAGNFTGAVYLSGVTFAAGAPEVLLSAGNTFFTLGSPATNAAPTTVQVEAAGNITWTLVYFL